jgi:hypothetical protein
LQRRRLRRGQVSASTLAWDQGVKGRATLDARAVTFLERKAAPTRVAMAIHDKFVLALRHKKGVECARRQAFCSVTFSRSVAGSQSPSRASVTGSTGLRTVQSIRRSPFLTDLPPRNGARVGLTWSRQPLQSRQSHRTCFKERPKVHPCQPRCCLAPHVRALGVYRPPSAAPRALLADAPPHFQPLPGSPARHGRSTALQKAHLKVLQPPRAACACPCP